MTITSRFHSVVTQRVFDIERDARLTGCILADDSLIMWVTSHQGLPVDEWVNIYHNMVKKKNRDATNFDLEIYPMTELVARAYDLYFQRKIISPDQQKIELNRLCKWHRVVPQELEEYVEQHAYFGDEHNLLGWLEKFSK